MRVGLDLCCWREREQKLRAPYAGYAGMYCIVFIMCLATSAGAPLAVGGAFTRRRPQRHDARPAAVVVPRERVGAQRVGGVAASVPGIISWHW